MSGFLGGAMTALARGSAIADGAMRSGRAAAGLLSGSVPFGAAGGAVTLGGFAFQGWEVPESISFGGEMQTVKHRFPGGAFALDLLGPDDHDIQWSGQMVGPDAAARAQQLDEMWREGATIDLAWGDFSYPVVVKSFEAEYRGRHWIGSYRIACMILPPPEADAGAETDALGDLSGDGEGGGILGALGDAASEVGAAVSDAADLAGESLGMVNGAVQAVSGVVTPLTSALGIQTPYLSRLQAGLGMAGAAVGTLGASGAGLQGFGSEYGSSAGFNSRVLDRAADLNAWGLQGADDGLDAAAAGSFDEAEPVSAKDAASATGAARDAAHGARAGGAINAARRNAARTGRPDGGTTAPAEGSATGPRAGARESAPRTEADRVRAAAAKNDSGSFLAARQIATEIRNSPAARASGPAAVESIIKQEFVKAGRPDLYEATRPAGLPSTTQFGGAR